MIETEEIEINLLDALDAFQKAHPERGFPSLGSFFGERLPELSDGVWFELLKDLEQRGLVRLADDFDIADCGLSLTAIGRRAVEEWRRRRNDPVLRNAAARSAILRYLYESHGVAHPHSLRWNSAYHYLGRPFEDAEITRAAEYLAVKDLVILSNAGRFMAELTSNGIDCVETFGGSVREYFSTKEATSVGPAVHFHGSANGANIAWNNQQVTQSVTTSGFVGDDLITLVDAFREATAVLNLKESDRTILENSLGVVANELAAQEPDREIVKTFMQRALGSVGKATNSALTLVLTAYTKHLMQQAGISPD